MDFNSEKLTDAERTCLQLVALGKTPSALADRFGSEGRSQGTAGLCPRKTDGEYNHGGRGARHESWVWSSRPGARAPSGNNRGAAD